MKTLIVVDVESDGPCPGLYSMVCFGAVAVTPALDKTFYGQTAPLQEVIPTQYGEPAYDYIQFDKEALAISGFTREQHLAFPHPYITMENFRGWLKQFPQPVFVSDNPAFDWQFINYYFHAFGEKGNPLGFSGRRIGDLYAGLKGDLSYANKWKHLRKTAHTHNPVDDAKGNAEALLAMAAMGLKGIL